MKGLVEYINESDEWDSIEYRVYHMIDTSGSSVEEKDYTFKSLPKARNKMKELNADHKKYDNTVLLSLWKTYIGGEVDGSEEGMNSKYSINRLDMER